MAAKALGGPFEVYRIQANSAINYLDPANLVSSASLVYYTQKSASGFRGSFEGTSLKVPLFDVIADMTQFYVGDVFVSTDLAYPRGFGQGAERANFETVEIHAFCLGFHGEIKKSIGSRIDRLAQIYQQGTAPTDGYFSADTGAFLPVILQNGQFSVGAVGDTAAFIPVGLASMERWRSDLFKAIPTSTSELVYYAYVPPLPGYTFREGDKLVLQDGSRYVVQNPYEQFVGFSGSQLVLAREVTQS